MSFGSEKVCRRLLIAWVALTVLVVGADAKRMPPKPVAPVIADGIRYSADGDGKNGYVVAEDAASGKVLWKVRVFHNSIKFWVEEDVRWVFITNLKLAGNLLLARDEDSRCYAISLKSKHVEKMPCSSAFPS